MKIEDLKIEDTADANYFIKKYFNNDYNKITMSQLEQLVLAVYSMGKNNGVGVSTDSAPDEIEPKPAGKAPAKASPFKISDRVKILEDFEIGHSGEFIKTDSIGTVTFSKGDTINVLFEAGEEGEMMEINLPLDKIEKVS